MKIKSIKAIGLYGRIDIGVTFNEDLSILVGINGSGKTSVIKIIDWLLTPNYDELSSVKYTKISLEVETKGELYRISTEPRSANNNKIASKLLNVECLTSKNNKFTSIVFADYNAGEVLQRYSFQLNKAEQRTHDFIKILESPLIISLDRKITAEIDDKIYREGIFFPRKTRNPNLDKIVSKTPLEYVQNIFRQTYAQQQAALVEIDSKLRNEIILAILNKNPVSKERSLNLLTLDGFEKFSFKTRQTMRNSGVDDNIQGALADFLERSYEKIKLQTTTYKQKENNSRVALEETLGIVDALMMAFRLHELNRRRASQSVDRYIHAVNQFLADTGKMVFVERATGQLRFRYIVDIQDTHGHSLDGLSSGELQILVIFGLFGLNEKPKRVFIIDEPELSLHPKWQINFMDILQFISQGDSQLIITTHSPEIVGSKKQKCIIVK